MPDLWAFCSVHVAASAGPATVFVSRRAILSHYSCVVLLLQNEKMPQLILFMYAVSYLYFTVCKLEVLLWVVIRFTTWYVFHTFIALFYQFEPYELIWHLTENTLYFKIWTFYLVNLKNLCYYKAHNYGLQISYIFLFNDILVLRHIFCRFLWRIIIITLSKFNS